MVWKLRAGVSLVIGSSSVLRTVVRVRQAPMGVLDVRLASAHLRVAGQSFSRATRCEAMHG